MSLSGNFTAIKPLLQQQILAVMDLSAMGIVTIDFSKGAELTPRRIPMHRLADDSCLVYRSAIALKLAPLAQRPALDIANQLIASFPTTRQDNSDSTCLDFSVEVAFPGWINFRLSEQSLATWLQHLIQIPPLEERGRRGGTTRIFNTDAQMKLRGSLALYRWHPCPADGEIGRKSNKESSEMLDINHQGQLDEGQNTQNLFPVQYAHARCCSLLRLAHGQGLIQLRDLDFNTLSWQLVEPNPIPWLNDDQNTDMGQVRLRLVHSAERRLIAQILDLLDDISDQAPRHRAKQASALSNAFENFYSSCRIWGEVKTQTPKLAQARLGLVGVTQVVLRSLLQDQLGVPAPVEL